jgi:Fe-S cluster assembly ATPase SufC
MDVKKVKKLYAYAIPSLKAADKMFAGEVNWNKKEYDKYKKSALRLEKINKKLINKVENTWKVNGVKMYKFSNRQKQLNKTMKKHLPKKVISNIERNGFSFNSIKKKMFNGVSSGTISSPTSGQARSNSFAGSSTDSLETIIEKLKSGVDENGVKLSEDQIQRLKASKQATLVLRNKKYKMDDIHPKHVNLFQTISYRYAMSTKQLDQSGIKEIVNNEDRQKALTNIYDLVDILN